MSFGFNSKFQDTAGKRNKLYNSVSNIFEISENNDEAKQKTEEGQIPLKKQNTRAIIRQIENDALRFHDTSGIDKIKFFCKCASGVSSFDFFGSFLVIFGDFPV